MIKVIAVKDLKQGMMVAKDVYTDKDELVVSSKSILSRRAIQRLESYNIVKIPVWIDDGIGSIDDDVPEDEEEVVQKPLEEDKLNGQSAAEQRSSKGSTASERMKQSESFKKFNKAFIESTKVAEKVIDDIAIRGGNINTKLIDSMINRVLDISNNGLYVFDMLHCMRELDDLTYAHSMSVALMSKIFGQWLHMSDEDIETLKVAGFLHDIGKVKVPREIICKAGRLSKTEYEIVKNHTIFGYEILKDKKLDERVKLTALMHHERCDGTGYPNKMKSKDIDDIAKIVAIADAYEAMTATRCYREALCPFSVIEEIERQSLTYYDPKYILPLMEMLAQSYIGNNVLLSNGEIGEVALINKDALGRPVVRTEYSYVNLSKDKSINIKAVI